MTMNDNELYDYKRHKERETHDHYYKLYYQSLKTRELANGSGYPKHLQMATRTVKDILTLNKYPNGFYEIQ